MEINVECYSGYRGEETPRFIILQSSKIEVKEVVDRWLAPDHRYFKCIGDDQAVYIIRHDLQSWKWELIFYQAFEIQLNRDGEGE
ncbi:MAG: hypothetical protein PVF56_25575 [Desulfobacterales bacterium]|jgi:hypothetical protein